VNREQKILAAAERLFSARSFDGVSIDQIASEAGIVGSGVYKYFDGKQDILLTLLNQAADTALLHVPEPTGDPFDDLHNLVHAHVAFCISHASLADIWNREHHALDSKQRRHFTRRQHRYSDLWVTSLDACYPGHCREDLNAAVRALHALTSSDASRPSGSKPAPHLTEVLTKLALASIEGLQR
jgi:AcrR family transcriptional regulator